MSYGWRAAFLLLYVRGFAQSYKKSYCDPWARSEVGLSRLPVTEKIAGSNPVEPASILK